VPTHTFVEPVEYRDLLLNLRTPGRGLVIEGPSGIGKTTAVETALKQLGISTHPFQHGYSAYSMRR
jgi:MoxR-like ATPase